MYEDEVDIDEQWSYSITGSWRAKYYRVDLFCICWEAKTADEGKRVLRGSEFINSVRTHIERCYDKLTAFVRDQHSRLAYLVLGWFLMFFGGRMTEEVKREILKYSEWSYEKNQFKTEEERELRKRFLFEFREKIIKYKEGTRTLVSEESLSDIYYYDGPWNLTPINYEI